VNAERYSIRITTPTLFPNRRYRRENEREMPKDIPSGITRIGGKSTELGRSNFLQKAAEIRARILANQPEYKDITSDIMSGEYSGTLSKPAAGFAAKRKRKGNKMPKTISTLNNSSKLNGKRGRKGEFKSEDFVMDIGGMLDVTEGMVSGISKLDAKDKFDSELLFTTDNENVNKYRTNRFGGLKRAAIVANGKDSKYSLEYGEDDEGNKVLVIVRNA